MPFFPRATSGYYYGTGTTAVRFCLFGPDTSRVAWNHAEWFYAGLDLRDNKVVAELVRKVHEDFLAVKRH